MENGCISDAESSSPVASPLSGPKNGLILCGEKSEMSPLALKLNQRLETCRELLENKQTDTSEVGTNCCSSWSRVESSLYGALLRLDLEDEDFSLEPYKDEIQLDAVMGLITKDLSEPYSIYTYRYFIHNWPHLCFLAKKTVAPDTEGDDWLVGAIVCKLEVSRHSVRRGYIAMLAVHQDCRRKKIGSRLVGRAISTMREHGCDEVVLETEVTNEAALRLYGNLGFVRDKRLFRYYLNGVDAFRLKLWLSSPEIPTYY